MREAREKIAREMAGDESGAPGRRPEIALPCMDDDSDRDCLDRDRHQRVTPRHVDVDGSKRDVEKARGLRRLDSEEPESELDGGADQKREAMQELQCLTALYIWGFEARALIVCCRP